MNRIVRDHYPVEKLPADLREGLAGHATVRIEIEVEPEAAAGQSPQRVTTLKETLEMIAKYRAKGHPSVSSEEAVARIRELRDEWDD